MKLLKMSSASFKFDDNLRKMSMNKRTLLLAAFFSCGGLNHVSEGPMNKWCHWKVGVNKYTKKNKWPGGHVELFKNYCSADAQSDVKKKQSNDTRWSETNFESRKQNEFRNGIRLTDFESKFVKRMTVRNSFCFLDSKFVSLQEWGSDWRSTSFQLSPPKGTGVIYSSFCKTITWTEKFAWSVFKQLTLGEVRSN